MQKNNIFLNGLLFLYVSRGFFLRICFLITLSLISFFFFSGIIPIFLPFLVGVLVYYFDLKYSKIRDIDKVLCFKWKLVLSACLLNFFSFLFFFYKFLLIHNFLNFEDYGSIIFSKLEEVFFFNTSFYWLRFLDVKWCFSYDYLALNMALVVSLVSLMVQLYSYDYMGHDPNFVRFFSLLSFFEFFMLLLVTSTNFVTLFFGWEGVGFCSYLLINFWSSRLQANKAAIKAMVVNKIGDCALLFAIVLIYINTQTLMFDKIILYFSINSNEFWNYFYGQSVNLIDIICFFLFLAAMGKSAQLGLHTWLPDAMEGPTPVSSLLHAATMVTAGVFLIIRLAPLFELSNEWIHNFIIFIGASTALMAATIGLVQYDIKKIIAYSTCSQLGYMVLSCGLGYYGAALYHLTTHAFFKALLFMCAGSIIHNLNDEQDIRRMGGLWKHMPLLFICFLFGSLSLTGFPLTSGYYSKDLILELSTYSSYSFHLYGYVLGLITVFLTAFYSTRVLYLVFFNNVEYPLDIQFKSRNYQKKFLHDINLFLFILFGILVLFSLFLGGIVFDYYHGLEIFFDNSLNYRLNEVYFFIMEGSWINRNIGLKLLPLYLSVFGYSLGFIYYYFYRYFVWIWSFSFIWNIYLFFLNKWYFDIVYNRFINLKIFKFAYNSIFVLLDKGWLEFFGPEGFKKIYFKIYWFWSLLFNGSLPRYLKLIWLFIILIIIYFFVNG